jgi:HlyD family secretion protein
MMPRRFGPQRRERQVSIGRGSMQTLYILGADGQPQPVQVRVGDTNGSLTEVVGGLNPGQKVITSRLATGKSNSSSGGNQRGGSSRRRSGGPNG